MEDGNLIQKEKEDNPSGKGEINCQISGILFNLIKGSTIRTHHLDTVGPTMLCTKVDIVPIEVVVRNIASGSIVRQTTIEEGTVFSTPLVEFYLKDDDKNDPLLTKRRLRLMGYDLNKEIEPLEQMAHDVNYKLRKIFKVLENSRLGMLHLKFLPDPEEVQIEEA